MNPPIPDRPERHTTFAIVLDRFLDKYAQSIVAGVAEFTKENNIHLLCAVTAATENPSPLRDLIGPANVDGLMFVGAMLTNFLGDASGVAKFLERYAPLPSVSIGEAFYGMHSVSVDNRAGMSAAVEHLIIYHGLKQIAFIRGPASNMDANERYNAYEDVLKTHGIPIDPGLVQQGAWTLTSGAACTRKLLETRAGKFQAIVCANDAMATGAINALNARGLLAGVDVAVTGFDNIGESDFALTTVNQPTHQIGRRAAQKLLDLCRGKTVDTQTRMASELVVRSSCGCAGSRFSQAVQEEAESGEEQISPLIAYRDPVMLAMAHALGNVTDGKIPDWLATLYDAFALDVLAGPAGRFVGALESLLAAQIAANEHINAWHGAIAVMRDDLSRHLHQPETIVVTEGLWRQAELSIESIAKRFRAGMTGSKLMRAVTMQDAPPPAGSLAELAEKFTEKLSALNIDRCYMVLFEDQEPIPKSARVVLAYDRSHPELRVPSASFPAALMLPRELFSSDFNTLLVMSLRKDNRHLGLVFFDRGYSDGFVYESLRWQFSEQLFTTLKARPEDFRPVTDSRHDAT